MASKLAERFFNRFAGLMRSHGTYAIGVGLKADAKGKLTGKRKTVHEPYTADLWDLHLAGTYAIGVVPINEKSMCRFAAGDIDLYDNFDLKALNARVQKLGLPLIVCRTKSGGAHLYLFTDEWVPAGLIQKKMTEWMIALGYAGVEVFPKQIRLASEHGDPVEDSTGNWINMPVAGGEFSNRYALDPQTGDALTPEQFLDLADRLAVADEFVLEGINPKGGDLADMFAGGPPCLQTLAVRGFGDWDNNSLFNIGVYLRKRYPETWEDLLHAYNAQFLETPLTTREVNDVARSLQKKSYGYMCKQDPICRVCDKKTCKDREFGVGGLPDDAGVLFGELIKLKTDPVTWIWDINGARLEIDTATLMDQRKFQARAIEVLSLWPVLIKPATWKKMIMEKLASADTVEVPEDATREGQLWVHLSRFCTSRVAGRALDEVLMGKPYTDEKTSITYFQAADFFQYLQQHRVSGISERDVWKLLHRRGADKLSKVIKGKATQLWTVPAFSTQTEEHAVPRVKLPDSM